MISGVKSTGSCGLFAGSAAGGVAALGLFEPAGAAQWSDQAVAGRGVDFDGDGIADALIGYLGGHGGGGSRLSGSRTAMARSGRDGHLIWKNFVDARGRWFDPTSRDAYDLSAFALPAGDLDGDGTVDVIVRKRPASGWSPGWSRSSANIELLSGRTGARLWTVRLLPDGTGASGLDWLEPRVIEPHGAPDLIVQSGLGETARLARVSGRSGRILWDVDVSGERRVNRHIENPPHFVADLDGDGGLDCLTVLPHSDPSELPGYILAAVSLRDGKLLWSRVVTLRGDFERLGDVRVGDIDGDKRCEVVVVEGFGGDRGKIDVGIRVFDGRDGALRWRWKPDMGRSIALDRQAIALANFEGRGVEGVCVACVAAMPSGLQRRIVVLGPDGEERVQREAAAL